MKGGILRWETNRVISGNNVESANCLLEGSPLYT